MVALIYYNVNGHNDESYDYEMMNEYEIDDNFVTDDRIPYFKLEEAEEFRRDQCYNAQLEISSWLDLNQQNLFGLNESVIRAKYVIERAQADYRRGMEESSLP